MAWRFWRGKDRDENRNKPNISAPAKINRSRSIYVSVSFDVSVSEPGRCFNRPQSRCQICRVSVMVAVAARALMLMDRNSIRTQEVGCGFSFRVCACVCVFDSKSLTKCTVFILRQLCNASWGIIGRDLCTARRTQHLHTIWVCVQMYKVVCYSFRCNRNVLIHTTFAACKTGTK